MTDTLYIAHQTGSGLQRMCLPNILRLRISYDIENKCESSHGQSGSGKKTDNSALNWQYVFFTLVRAYNEKRKEGNDMDQIKIGRFIAQKRKEQKMTQNQLAEKLGITDRAVSKWETGKSLPDASIMLELCDLLGITVNDLLCGEVVSMKNYNETAEKTLLEMVEQKERADKRLLSSEIVLGMLATLFLFSMIFIAALIEMQDWIRIVLIIGGFIVFLTGIFFALRIEQTAGYYECAKCGHRYVPSYKSVTMAMHMGRTRYMKCPECGKRSWQKKVISKD